MERLSRVSSSLCGANAMLCLHVVICDGFVTAGKNKKINRGGNLVLKIVAMCMRATVWYLSQIACACVCVRMCVCVYVNAWM